MPKQTIWLSDKFFNGYLPQILLGPFLNTLTHIATRSFCKNDKKPWYEGWNNLFLTF